MITFGMAGVAWAAAVRELWRPRHGDATRWTLGVALVASVGVASGASVILAGITGKPLDAIYGRYVQMLAPFWMLVGLGCCSPPDVGWCCVVRPSRWACWSPVARWSLPDSRTWPAGDTRCATAASVRRT
ncbi:hypothetical protein NKG94_20230 [Micromonospora sp. M12]